jgi:hypothetical protein
MLFGSLPSSRPRAFHVVGVVNMLTPLLQRATSGVSTPFSIAGAPIARDALALEFGVDRHLTSNVKLGVYYSGLLSLSASDNAIRAKLEAPRRPRVRRFTRGLGDARSCARSLAVRGGTEGFTNLSTFYC